MYLDYTFVFLTTLGQPKVEQKLPAVGSSGLMALPGSATYGNSAFGLKQPFVVTLTARFITQSRHNLKAGGLIFFVNAAGAMAKYHNLKMTILKKRCHHGK